MLSLTALCQTDTTEKEEVLDWFNLADKPEFPQGQDSMMRFISAYMVIPPIARVEAESGTILVGFVVEQDGSLSNIKIVSKRMIGFGLEQAAIAVFKAMPNWNPATKGGKPISTRMQIPIRVVLN